MASPLNTGKQTVDLATSAAPAVRGSRIRREPPPPERKTLVMGRGERDQNTVVIGVLVFALAIFILILAFAGYTGSGWTPANYEMRV